MASPDAIVGSAASAVRRRAESERLDLRHRIHFTDAVHKAARRRYLYRTALGRPTHELWTSPIHNFSSGPAHMCWSSGRWASGLCAVSPSGCALGADRSPRCADVRLHTRSPARQECARKWMRMGGRHHSNRRRSRAETSYQPKPHPRDPRVHQLDGFRPFDDLFAGLIAALSG